MRVVIGVDSGGSRTRALAVTLEREPVGYAEGGGGNPTHDAASRENVRETIRRAAEGCGIGNVVRVVAGIAGFNYPDQEASVAEATAVPGLAGARTHLNDAEVAHFAAFGGGPGIVTIQGTGSMILAILEDGRPVRNQNFGHYARAGAVWLGQSATFRLLTDPAMGQCDPVREAAFREWEVDSLVSLREAVARVRELSPHEASRRFGAIARATTEAAEAGWAAAGAACDAAVREIVTGVRLLGPMFVAEEVMVAPIGACVRSAAMREGLVRRLGSARERRYRVVEPAAPPVVGAVRMALREEGVELGEAALRRLGDLRLEAGGTLGGASWKEAPQ